MSRYSLRPLARYNDLFEIALGWDPGLGTYFVTVFGTPDCDREPDIRLWRGTGPREIGAVARGTAQVRPGEGGSGEDPAPEEWGN